MILRESFEILMNDGIIGNVVKEMLECWEKHGCPNVYVGSPTTEIPSGAMEISYWVDYELEDEIYADHYNRLMDSLLDLIDVRNIASRNNPIWYTHYYHDEKFTSYESNDELIDGYYEECMKIISNSNIYDNVCEIEKQTLLDMGYEYTETNNDEE